MAGAKPGVHALTLTPLRIHGDLIKGSKFVRYEEDSSSSLPTLGTLKVDEGGFFLTWVAGCNGEPEIIDVLTIRDTRYGKLAKQPKDAKVRESLGKEAANLTIVSGLDLVNLTFWNFYALTEETAKFWAEELYKVATNILHVNGSRNNVLLKAFTRLQLYANQDGRITLKCFLKMFSDKKRVEMALDQIDILDKKADSVKSEDLTMEKFQKFLDSLCLRPELQSILEECGAKRKPFLTLEQFADFINVRQRDSRLNEVLYPPLKREQVRAIMEKYEPNIFMLDRDQISLQAFSRYLGGDENGIVPPERLDVYDEMHLPLSHYFINSSHNTYLTAGQLSGLSSVEMYRQVLLTGCRCIELDCWKGRPPEEEPYITHGFTMTTEIPFKDVIEAIAESAFKASPYPLILSFENHVDSAKQQEKMAEYCKEIFGSLLLIDPLDKYPLVPGQSLPSPEELKGKILIKNKKKHNPTRQVTIRRKELEGQPSPPYGDSEDEEEEETPIKKPTSDEGTACSETYATEEMSNLVNYVQPVKFKSFAEAAKKKKFFEMSSFVETKGLEALKNYPSDFVEYNKNQMSRIYPKGTRVDSSNYMPQIFWNAGCQMVALNFQTLDLPMQLNNGVFEYNGHCGYLLKPEFMRRPDKHFDPFMESIVDGIVANTLKIKIISGQFLSERKVGIYVEVDIFGLPVDTKRKFRTKTSNGNSLDPVWEEEVTFYKLVLPTLASLRIAVYEENGRFIGHRVLPVSAIRPGYHYIVLRNELNQPLLLPSLLVHTDPRDYVPDEHIEYAEALTNPIKHVNMLAKREKQLACFMDDNDKGQQVENTEGTTPDPIPSNLLPASPSIDFPDIPRPPAPAPTVREDLVNNVFSDIPFTSLCLEELMKNKNYAKLDKKQKKDFSELQKKNQKKVQAEIQKKRKEEKKIDKKSKRSIKKSDSQDLEQDLEKLKAQLLEQQTQELLTLRRELFELEKKMQQEHQKKAHENIREQAAEHHNDQLKKLKHSSDKERKELQKMLERRRLNSISEAKERLKADVDQTEINRKHIAESVECLRKLEKAQSLREEKFTIRHQEWNYQLETQLAQLQLQLDEKLKEEDGRLQDEIRLLLQLDLEGKGAHNDSSSSPVANHSSPNPLKTPNCSTPSLGFLGSLRRSIDNSLLDNSTSSPSTPGLSEAEISFK